MSNGALKHLMSKCIDRESDIQYAFNTNRLREVILREVMSEFAFKKQTLSFLRETRFLGMAFSLKTEVRGRHFH